MDDVLRYNTLFPLGSRFIPPEDFKRITEHFLDAPADGLQSKQGSGGPRSGWARHRLLRCPKCLEVDVDPFGKPFWRRDHLLPGVLVCGLHEIPLYEACELCMDYECNIHRILHAGYHCGCGLRPISDASTLADGAFEIEVKLAQICSQLLDPDYLPHLNHLSIASQIAEAAVGHGLVKNNQFIWEITQDYFSSNPIRPLVERTGIVIERSQSLANVLKGRNFLRHPIEAIAMLLALNPDWSQLEQAIMSEPKPEVQRSACAVVPKASRPKKDWTKYHQAYLERNFEELFKRFADLYQEIREEFPELSHVQIMRRLPTSANDVLTEDLLEERGYDVPRVFKNGVRASELAVDLVIHINARGEHLRVTRYPNRITDRVLMRGFSRPKATSTQSLAGRLDGVEDALKRNRETPADWKRRIASYGPATSARSQSYGHHPAPISSSNQ